MRYKLPKFKSGFSLVELLVVLAIIVIMTAVLLVNQNGNKAQADVETAARQFAVQLRSFQNEALNGKQMPDPNAGNALVSVCDFKFMNPGGTNNTAYSVAYYNCASPTHKRIGAWQSIELNSGKKNVFFNTPSNSWSSILSFSAPMGQLTPQSNYRISFWSKNDPTKKSSVCICSSGNIYEQKNDAACVC